MRKIGQHLNIVACYGFMIITFPNNMISLVMEKCVGTLYDLVPKDMFLARKLRLYEVSRIMKQLLEGLAYLHDRDIVHR